jgi:hypothetical protein
VVYANYGMAILFLRAIKRRYPPFEPDLGRLSDKRGNATVVIVGFVTQCVNVTNCFVDGFFLARSLLRVG